MAIRSIYLTAAMLIAAAIPAYAGAPLGVPAPAALPLIGLGLVALGVIRKRK